MLNAVLLLGFRIPTEERALGHARGHDPSRRARRRRRADRAGRGDRGAAGRAVGGRGRAADGSDRQGVRRGPDAGCRGGAGAARRSPGRLGLPESATTRGPGRRACHRFRRAPGAGCGARLHAALSARRTSWGSSGSPQGRCARAGRGRVRRAASGRAGCSAATACTRRVSALAGLDAPAGPARVSGTSGASGCAGTSRWRRGAGSWRCAGCRTPRSTSRRSPPTWSASRCSARRTPTLRRRSRQIPQLAGAQPATSSAVPDRCGGADAPAYGRAGAAGRGCVRVRRRDHRRGHPGRTRAGPGGGRVHRRRRSRPLRAASGVG